MPGPELGSVLLAGHSGAVASRRRGGQVRGRQEERRDEHLVSRTGLPACMRGVVWSLPDVRIKACVAIPP
eukprot:508950-Rhodomonas_salina.2